MQRDKDRWVRRAILIIGTAIFLFSALTPMILRRASKKDREGAIPQRGVATVVLLVPPMAPSVLSSKESKEPQVTVRFNGKLYAAREVVDYDHLRVNHPAQIVYSIGKSGRIYVERVAPLASAGSGG